MPFRNLVEPFTARAHRRKRTARGARAIVVGLGLAVLGGSWLAGCAESDPGADEERRTGGEGESCAATADCDSGLACIGHVCTADRARPGDGGPGIVRSQLGESCASTPDCEIGLACIDQICSDGAMQPGDDGGAAVRSQLGESCGARRDCEAGLACINQVCVEPDEPDGGPADEERGQRGETCRTRVDCESGLACVASACVIGDFGIEPTENECVLIECREPEDCCPVPPAVCPTYKAYCDQDPVTYATYCTFYDLNCVCNGDNYLCSDFLCETLVRCDDMTPCPGTQICDDGSCVQCVSDDDCAATQACVENRCTASCEIDEECPVFNVCMEGGCVDVGCQTDRECVAATRSVLSFCAEGECVQPCSADYECSNPSQFNNRVCVEGTCVDAGCETDEECRIRLNVTAVSGSEAECQPKD